MLLVPEDRLDTVWLRDLRRGSTAGLTRSERPGGELLERWIDAGAHFVTEVSSLARLLFDNLPLHRATWNAAAIQQDGHATLVCQLPRVARVLGVELHPAEGRSCRILVSSDIEISVGELVEKAG